MEVITKGDNATTSITVDKVTIHEDFKKGESLDKPSENDVALIHLKDKITDVETLTISPYEESQKYHAYTKSGVVSDFFIKNIKI